MVFGIRIGDCGLVRSCVFLSVFKRFKYVNIFFGVMCEKILMELFYVLFKVFFREVNRFY